MPPSREPPLRPDELRTLRAMMQEYRMDKAVSSWLGAKGRLVVVTVACLSGAAVLAASILDLVEKLH